jgi:hypothetical protein
MARKDNSLAAVYKGLQALADSSFPRKCVTCGRVFENVEEFLFRTNRLWNSSGLKEATGDDQNPVVELYRNCPCGSTLLEICSDRRDTSEAGEDRRARFGRMLDLLGTQFAVHRDEARFELLKILRGQRSPLLEGLGIRPQE